MTRFRIVAIAMSLTLVSAAAIAGPTQPTKFDDELKPWLRAICLAHSTGEPICGSIDKLTTDEIWLALRNICAAPPANADTHCGEFRTRQGGVLVYDAAAKKWKAYWESKEVETDFDVAGVPTLRLRRTAAPDLKIIVTSISPLSYSASAGTPKEEDLQIIANLKTLLATAGSALGSGLARTVTLTAQTTALTNALTDETTAESKSSASKGFNAYIKNIGPKPAPCVVAIPDLSGVSTLIVARNELLKKAGKDLETMNKALKDLESTRDTFISSAQQAEYGDIPWTTLGTSHAATTASAYSTFGANLQPLSDATESLASCQPLMSAYSNLLSAPNSRSAIDSLAQIVQSYQCGVTDLQNTIHTNANDLAASVSASCTTAEIEAGMKVQKAAMQPMIDRLQNAPKVEEAFWKAVDAVGTGKKEVLRGATTLDRTIASAELHTWNKKLIRELIVTRPNPELPWNKTQTHSIVVKIDTPYQKELTLTQPAEGKYEYKLESRTGQILGYSIGLIYTPLMESTWTAVSVPGGTSKVIAETKQEGRAGKLAAFLNYRFLEHVPTKAPVQPTLDFGVGLDTDKPSFFLGAGIDIKKAARIGYGWSPQRVTMLADGQTPNVTVVSSNDDIRTIKKFERKNWYVSFSFALDSLSLFNSK